MSLPQIVDSHCHLDFPQLSNDLDAVVSRAQAAGVSRMVTICTKLREEPQVRAIAGKYAGVFYAAGTHPMNVADEPMVTVEDLVSLAKYPKFVGIGETGLDYHYTSQTAGVQAESLRIHIEAARQTGLPLIIHARAADDDIAAILVAEYRASPFTCVMHCFSSGAELARKALDLGFYLSISGIATFKKSHDLRAIFKAAPRDRILLETDSPYLAPTPHRGKPNEPAFTRHTAETGAEIFGMDFEEFAQLTTANFDRLFSKAAAWSGAS